MESFPDDCDGHVIAALAVEAAHHTALGGFQPAEVGLRAVDPEAALVIRAAVAANIRGGLAAQYPGAALSSQSSAARVAGTAPRSEEAAIISAPCPCTEHMRRTPVLLVVPTGGSVATRSAGSSLFVTGHYS